MSKKTVVILPGSAWQIPIVRKVKDMGYRALVVNPYKNSPAFSFADGHLCSDIFDIKAVKQYCETEKADALISEECDIAMPVVAKLGKDLGFNTLSEDAARLFTDKNMMRIYGEKNGFPTPKHRVCYTKEDVFDFLKNINGKIIIKPLDSNSSRGVFTIENESQIEEHFDESLSYSKIEKAVLAEQYIDGIEFTVDGVKTPQGHFTLAISEKRHFKHNLNIASDLYFTWSNKNYDYSLLKQINDEYVNNSPLLFGLTHAEYKYENGTFYLIEIAARGGGNLISSHIAPFMSGRDNYEYLIKCSVNGAYDKDFKVEDEFKGRAAVLKFFDCESSGTVQRIDGLEILRDMPEIAEYKFNFEVGDHIEKASNDATRVGFYIALCNTEERLKEVMKIIKENVRIVVKKDEDDI